MKKLAEAAAAALSAVAVPADAEIMAAYMKTQMPFYGVKKPARVQIFRELKQQFAPRNDREYVSGVRALWRGKHREEKYLAIVWAVAFKKFITLDKLPLYEQLIREGQWWDFVDDVAIRLTGQLWQLERDTISELMDAWIDDDDLWIRRSAIIGQLKHKADTDEARLFGYCERRMAETEFFIRKGIGWALRQHSYTDPKKVKRFLLRHEAELSGLSFREGAKAMKRLGTW